MSDFTQQIEEIKQEIRKTPYHKGTEHYIGKLRARLARLRDKELEATSRKSGGGKGFAIKKQGDAAVVLIGPPSSGKSTLINKLTNAESKVAPYAFTTLTVIPGMLKYNDAYIQILDVPGIIEGARTGKGRGKEVLSVARNCDLLVIMTDIQRVKLFDQLVFELEDAGIRINQLKPNVRIEKKIAGGIIIHSNLKQDLNVETTKSIANEFGLKNAEITLKEKVSLENLIDSFSSNRVYLPAIFVVNKIDQAKSLSSDSGKIYISAEKGTGLDKFKEVVWDKLHLIRVYLVEEGQKPSFDHPLIMRQGQKLSEVAEKIGSEFRQTVELAKIWGKAAHYPGQEVPLSTNVQEGMQIRFI